MLSFRGWLLSVALMKPTPRQNCLTSLIYVLQDKGMNLAGCQLINRPLMNLCHYQQGVSTLLGTCCQREVEDREFLQHLCCRARGPQGPSPPPPRASTIATPRYHKEMDISKEKEENPGQNAPRASTQGRQARTDTRAVIIQSEHLQENNIFCFLFFFQ